MDNGKWGWGMGYWALEMGNRKWEMGHREQGMRDGKWDMETRQYGGTEQHGEIVSDAILRCSPAACGQHPHSMLHSNVTGATGVPPGAACARAKAQEGESLEFPGSFFVLFKKVQ